MIKIEEVDVYGYQNAIRGMRNPMNSWSKSDSDFGIDCNYKQFNDIGINDLNLMKKLSKAGTDHRKFMRMIVVYADITAPLYWWKEYDTYKVGTVANSCSTMHRLTNKPFEVSDFSFEHLIGNRTQEYFDVDGNGEEKWITIKDFPDYEVSTFGNVFSKKRNKLLKPCVNSSNYKKFVLKGKNLYAHRLVAEAFIPNDNNLEEVNHKDGNKWNNNVTNLEWVTKSENSIHAFENGLRNISGYTRYRVAKSDHRFSSQDVEEMFSLYNDGMSKKEIAKKFKCYDSTVCNILNGKTYKQIDLSPYDVAKIIVDHLNELRDIYIETNDKNVWWQMIQLLPSSYNQKRTVMLNYEVLANIYKSRKNHKLDEWVSFCEWIESLPYSEIITGNNDEDKN